MEIFKNGNDRFELDGEELTCGHPVALCLGLYGDEEEQWVKGRIEHDGREYYFCCPNNKRIKLSNGDWLKNLR